MTCTAVDHISRMLNVVTGIERDRLGGGSVKRDGYVYVWMYGGRYNDMLEMKLGYQGPEIASFRVEILVSFYADGSVF